MTCPSCRCAELPVLHAPGRDRYGRPLCDDCLDVQARSSTIARRIVDEVLREYRADVAAFIRSATQAGMQASRAKRSPQQ
jgi:hypothetical protein